MQKPLLRYSLMPIHIIGVVSLFDGHMVAEGLLLQPIALLYVPPTPSQGPFP